LSWQVLASVLFLGFFCSGLAYVFWSQSLRDLEAAKTGAFLYLEPFVTVLTAWIILEENITLLIIVSGIIITAGVVMVNLKKPSRIFQ
jgi:drug/metabolite transporter (DMT)-like permease